MKPMLSRLIGSRARALAESLATPLELTLAPAPEGERGVKLVGKRPGVSAEVSISGGTVSARVEIPVWLPDGLLINHQHHALLETWDPPSIRSGLPALDGLLHVEAGYPSATIRLLRSEGVADALTALFSKYPRARITSSDVWLGPLADTSPESVRAALSCAARVAELLGARARELETEHQLRKQAARAEAEPPGAHRPALEYSQRAIRKYAKRQKRLLRYFQLPAALVATTMFLYGDATALAGWVVGAVTLAALAILSTFAVTLCPACGVRIPVHRAEDAPLTRCPHCGAQFLEENEPL